jgi:hypothetical protein
VAALVLLRLRRALRLAERRWAAASGGGALAGLVGGLLGGVALFAVPGSVARPSILPALAVVGACVGALGAAGVGAGLAAAEALARSARGTALAALGALGGGAIGALSHALAVWTIEGLFGQDLDRVGGGLEGLVLGAAAGAGYALATPTEAGGMATPRGRARARVALVTGLACALAGVFLALAGRPLAGASLDVLAAAFHGSQTQLVPLARWLGEREFGPATRAAVGAYEGLLFGAGLAWGLTRRP